MRLKSISRNSYFPLIVPVSALLTFALLFIFRQIDDNRLTSWKWAFGNIDPTFFIPLLLTGLIAAYILSKLSFFEKQPALFLFVSSFAVCTLFWQTPEVILDASRYFTQAKHLELYGIEYFIREWGSSINAWTDMPLSSFIYGMIFKLFGESRTYIQVFNSFLFSMTTVLTYLIGKTLWNEVTGFFAGLMLLAIPFIFSQVPLMLVDLPTMFFLTLSIFTFIKAMEKGGHWTGLSSVSIFLTFFVKYSTWMMLSIIPIIFIIYLLNWDKGRGVRGKRREVISRTLYVALFAGILIGIVVLYKYDVIIEQIRFLNEYQRPGLRRWGESFASTFLFQAHPFITIAALYSVIEAFRKKDPKFIIISWLILLVIVFQIRRSRYVMIVFPMFTLMASYGLQRIRDFELKKFIVYCAVISSLIVAVFAYLPFLKTMGLVNMKHAGEFLNSVDTGKIEIFTLPSGKSLVNPAVSVPLLDLHTDKNIIYHHDTDFSIPFKKIEKSSLRFTWEYKNPEYYKPADDSSDRDNAIVILSNIPGTAIPENIRNKIKGYKKGRVFNTSTRIFKYSPVVTVYLSN